MPFRGVKRLLIDHNDVNACRKHLCYFNSRESTILWKVDESQIVGKPFLIQNKVYSHSFSRWWRFVTATSAIDSVEMFFQYLDLIVCPISNWWHHQCIVYCMFYSNLYINLCRAYAQLCSSEMYRHTCIMIPGLHWHYDLEILLSVKARSVEGHGSRNDLLSCHESCLGIMARILERGITLVHLFSRNKSDRTGYFCLF